MLLKHRSVYYILYLIILYIHGCLSISCDGVNGWPITDEGNVASISCKDGKFGNMQRLCANINGVATWQPIDETNCRITEISIIF